jgi:hypothetical protein
MLSGQTIVPPEHLRWTKKKGLAIWLSRELQHPPSLLQLSWRGKAGYSLVLCPTPEPAALHQATMEIMDEVWSDPVLMDTVMYEDMVDLVEDKLEYRRGMLTYLKPEVEWAALRWNPPGERR